MKRLEVWFDFSCPYAYLASTQIEALAARTQASLDLRPMLLGGVFRARSTPQKLFSAIAPNKARHNAWDLVRFAQRWSVPYAMPDGHPFRSVTALRCLLVVGAQNLPLIHRLYRAYWAEGRDIAETSVIASVLEELGHDSAAVLREAESDPIKDQLRARTDEAIARGIFGAPAFFPHQGDAPAPLFWGQDRLDDVERALGGVVPPLAPRRLQRPVELCFDFACPYAALAFEEAERVLGDALLLRPVVLDRILRADYPPEGVLPATSEAKSTYLEQDLGRRAALFGHRLRPGVGETRLALSLCRLLGLEDPIAARSLVRSLFRQRFLEGKDLGDSGILSAALAGLNLDPAWLTRAQAPAALSALEADTDRAQESGVFGVPTFVVQGRQDGGIYFGSDRLLLAVEAAA
ncbi:MAG: DsbA family protein [Myxococcota bacterium]